MNQWKGLWDKYREIILYVVFGGLTTLVSFFSYWCFVDLFHIPYMASTALSWIVSVTFAYCTNRRWVFESRAHGLRAVGLEAARFFACRLFSGFLEMGLMFAGVDLLHINDKVVKLAANVIVILTNYILSKWLVFRKKRGVDESA